MKNIGAGLLKVCNVQNSISIQALPRALQRFGTQAWLSVLRFTITRGLALSTFSGTRFLCLT
jgi:hypothetical protein